MDTPNTLLAAAAPPSASAPLGDVTSTVTNLQLPGDDDNQKPAAKGKGEGVGVGEENTLFLREFGGGHDKRWGYDHEVGLRGCKMGNVL